MFDEIVDGIVLYGFLFELWFCEYDVVVDYVDVCEEMLVMFYVDLFVVSGLILFGYYVGVFEFGCEWMVGVDFD